MNDEGNKETDGGVSGCPFLIGLIARNCIVKYILNYFVGNIIE
jgi:hypothetical protein